MSFPESLLKVISNKEASKLSLEICKRIATLANIRIPENGNNNKSPGEVLLKYLHRSGCTLEQYKLYFKIALTQSYYIPQSKVAILVANVEYEHWSPLGTPSKDCDSLGILLSKLGFITVKVKNTKSSTLKDIISIAVSLIPEDSYCFIYYAGHGCELINVKCILGIDCPAEDIEFDHCITENWLLRESAKCKPELCVLIMDMCRFNLDRKVNPKIYASIPDIEEYTIHSNLLITYSTQSSNAAYEFVYLEKEENVGGATYSLVTEDIVCDGASLYANALLSRLTDAEDISTMLDKVHGDVENSIKNQRPIKIQCGVAKRSLHDPLKGDSKELLGILRDGLKQYKEFCSVS